ncbi:MAG: FKBP-type peptidyl-prolyl cis-trans isomerase [Candidatus Aenigmarchaeota archaeon]|nr:FKBP-type peptidyl-prolyl cis-trans isomerase [Candidatus Aenigmarchaeota archaeon]
MDEAYEFNPAQPGATQPGQKRKRRPLAYAGVIIVLGVVAFVTAAGMNPLTGMLLAPVAKAGDTVSVYYTGSADGKVFDTNIQAVAIANNIQRPTFEVLTFTVGNQQVIAGFDEALVGMRVGERKTVTIPPEKGYGPSNPLAIQEMPRSQELNRTEEIDVVVEVPLEIFIANFGVKKVGDVFTPPTTSLQYKVSAITNDSVETTLLAQVGHTYNLSGVGWTAEIVNVTSEKAFVKYTPQTDTVTTAYGNASVAVTADKIIITINPTVGSTITTPVGQGTIVAVDEENFTIDLNHFLAGKTMTFEIQLVTIKPQA